MSGSRFVRGLLCLIVGGLFASVAEGVIYPMEIFTKNTDYSDSDSVNLYIDVTAVDDSVSFTFYNDSLVTCSITRIYFESADWFDADTYAITAAALVAFDPYANGPRYLPAGHELTPPFIEDDFYMGAKSPVPWNGVRNNAGQWVAVEFDLTEGMLFSDVLAALNSGALRIGAHIQGFPCDEYCCCCCDGCCGASESAIVVPEPITLMLAAAGGIFVLRKKRRL